MGMFDMVGLGVLGLYMRIKKIIKPYDAELYWHGVGKKIPEGFGADKVIKTHRINALLELLQTLQFNSVLEFGCGLGHTTKHILDNFKVNDYVAFDISTHRLTEAKKLCGNYPVKFYVSSIDNFNTNEKFDLVVGTGVLHYVQPDKIKPTIKKLLGYSKKYFIHDDPTYDVSFNNLTAYHDFSHDYQKIYQELDHVVKIIPVPNQPKRALYYINLTKQSYIP